MLKKIFVFASLSLTAASFANDKTPLNSEQLTNFFQKSHYNKLYDPDFNSIDCADKTECSAVKFTNGSADMIYIFSGYYDGKQQKAFVNVTLEYPNGSFIGSEVFEYKLKSTVRRKKRSPVREGGIGRSAGQIQQELAENARLEQFRAQVINNDAINNPHAYIRNRRMLQSLMSVPDLGARAAIVKAYESSGGRLNRDAQGVSDGLIDIFVHFSTQYMHDRISKFEKDFINRAAERDRYKKSFDNHFKEKRVRDRDRSGRHDNYAR